MLTNPALQQYAGVPGKGSQAAGAVAPAPHLSTSGHMDQATAGTATATAVATPIPPLDTQALESAVKDISEQAQSLQRALQFHIDENSGRTIITVIDKETDEIIRQIPPEDVLSVAEQFRRGGGVFIETEA